ncbi:Uu.00g031100.m01.CDS01 [Anthostomella pinea]|uniref:Uu.00g031100.m01.CDS01 n=1 Tax=Anthostomella pinea TaxID=933095 RepID=A0AAI8V8X6_9PEZI|nr:Uu.00g031100.m01.CDS01 [Anthostomella pinea]
MPSIAPLRAKYRSVLQAGREPWVENIGGALIQPNAVALLSTTAGPGRVQNFSIASFAAAASLGGWLGAPLAAVITPWKWMFWCLSILAAVIVGLLWILLPPETPVEHIIMERSTTSAPHWACPGSSFFLVWESRHIKEPIMPLNVFKASSFPTVLLVVLLSAMSFAISLWYMLAWQQIVRGLSMLEIAVTWIPFRIGAIASTLVAAWLIPRLAAQWVLAIGAGAVGLSNLLLATMPAQQIYWAQTLPAINIGSFCPDLPNLSANRLALGLAGTVKAQVIHRDTEGRSVLGYWAALYFAFTIAVLAVLLNTLSVRAPKDQRQGWDDSRNAGVPHASD